MDGKCFSLKQNLLIILLKLISLTYIVGYSGRSIQQNLIAWNKNCNILPNVRYVQNLPTRNNGFKPVVSLDEIRFPSSVSLSGPGARYLLKRVSVFVQNRCCIVIFLLNLYREFGNEQYRCPVRLPQNEEKFLENN